MRSTIWTYTSHRFPCLTNLAKDIACGIDPHPSHGEVRLSALTDKSCPNSNTDCPKPINYFANGEDPNLSPLKFMGLAGRLAGSPWGLPTRFVPCNFSSLSVLACNKANRAGSWTSEQLRGFNLNSASGVAILLGPWSDFCLWCWARFPALNETEQPILILSKDNDTFPVPTFSAARDWGEDQVQDVKKIWGASDRSTQNLFGTLTDCAFNWPLGKVGRKPASPGEQLALQEYIAAKRIFIYNVWPWFRCGSRSIGDDGIHSDLSTIPCLWYWLRLLVDCLNPRKIAALGAWSWDPPLSSPDARLRSMLLSLFPGNIDVFLHPSAWADAWFKPWKNPSAWGPGFRWGGKANNEAFADFCR